MLVHYNESRKRRLCDFFVAFITTGAGSSTARPITCYTIFTKPVTGAKPIKMYIGIAL